jgi:hypothetical protein
VIVPDGRLTTAPIGGLIDGGGHYLLERYTVSYLNSWRELENNWYGQSKSSPPVVVADPDFDLTIGAPGAQAKRQLSPFVKWDAFAGEAQDVAKVLRVPPDRVLVGKMASEALVRSIVAPEILHFVTHSIPNLNWKVPVDGWNLFEFPQPLAVENPFLQSLIALAGANRVQTGVEDGLLTGLEVESLHLNGTRLVVLSSCQSGQGTPLDGQGVLGLRAAFSVAGAEGLVMSLWPVDDEAGRIFMRFFYSHIESGPVEALRAAQLEMMKEPRYAQPFYWAGYVYSGSRRPWQMQTFSSGDAAAPEESFTTPNCFQMSARQSAGGITHVDVIRVTLGGVVRQSQSSPTQVTYEMRDPGSDIEDRVSMSVGDGPPILDPLNSRTASQMRWPMTITVEKDPEKSGVLIQMGTPSRLSVTLQGRQDLFASLDIPEALPPLSSYTQATVSKGSDKLVIDSIGFCSDGPAQQ